MPCQDLFDWWSLRCGVWIVFLMALLGNGAVVFVLIFARSKIDVPRFLVCNLGMADFFMGIYLGFLAVVDASTLGEFRMYAIPWQLSAGCQVSYSFSFSYLGREKIGILLFILGRRFLRSAQLGAVRLHAGRHHDGEELRHHARHAPQQAAVVASRQLHHGRRLAVRPHHGLPASGRRFRLPQIRRLFAVRSRQFRQQRLRRFPYGHQRRRLPHSHGLLLESA